MQNEANLSLRKRAALLSLLVGIGMFVAKMGAYLITGSAAIFSDALESVVHVAATLMAFYSIILSSQPADDSHLYGHGNIEFFSAGVEGLLIVIAALAIIYTSVMDMIHGSVLSSLDIGAVVVALAGGINLVLGLYLVRQGRKTNSLTLVADGKHVLTDSYTSIGVLVGVVIVMITGIKIFDPLFAIAVALNILFTGYHLVRESIGGLMQETDEVLLGKITDALVKFRKSYWIDIHELRFWKSGDKVFADFHLILPYYFNIKNSHIEEQEIADFLEKELPNTQIKIHFDYCIPDLCKWCDYKMCDKRTEEKSRPNSWDKEKLIGRAVYMS